MFRSSVKNKSKKPGFSKCAETKTFLIFANNSKSKQSKRNPEHPFVDVGKKETCVKFQQKILNSMVVGARQSFQCFRHNAWFPKNNRALSKFLHEVLHYLKVH